MQIKYADEGMDCKKYVLFFLRKSWIAALAALVGAILGGGVYLFCHVVMDSNREYSAESKIYLDFAPDETGEVYQAYNGYTWNDLMTTEPILNTTMSYLPQDYTREEVEAATSAQILSDLRLLTITITTSDPLRAAEILRATDLSLVDLGQRAKEFTDIQIYKETEAKMAAASPRLLQAALVGLLLVLSFTLLVMAIFYLLQDKIYVPGDCRSITNLPFIGFCFTEKKEGKLAERLKRDLEQNRAYLEKETGTLITWKLEKNRPVSPEEAEKLRKAGGVLLVIPYGKMDRTSCSYQMEQLALLGCHTVGILIQDADMRFMKWYYNHL